MKQDFIDNLIKKWQAECPDLDVRPIAVVGRAIRIAELMKQRLRDLLRPHGLEVWEFEVLATLRWRGGEEGMTPTELMEALKISSGTLTHRIDQLEKTGFVKRVPNPNDRRSIRVHLAARGVEVVGEALVEHIQSANAAVSDVSLHDQRLAAGVLKRVLANVEDDS